MVLSSRKLEETDNPTLDSNYLKFGKQIKEKNDSF